MNYRPNIKTRVIRKTGHSERAAIGDTGTVMAHNPDHYLRHCVKVRWDRTAETHNIAYSMLSVHYHNPTHARLAHKARTQELVL